MFTYLALGDSYTIGEQVPLQQSFPFQTTTLLRQNNLTIADPVIIAQTGWTTDELATAIREQHIRETFSIVTLLIGVNNQYRGRTAHNYREEFESLLQQGIAFAGNNPQKLVVLSIPDWGVTPFAADQNREQIAQEIDVYNTINKASALAHGCHYLAITDSTRQHGTDPDFLAADGLHPSPKEYAVWAQQLAPILLHCLTTKQRLSPL